MKELKVKVIGFNVYTRKEFEEEIHFELVRSDNEFDYGNKHYMNVVRPKCKQHYFIDVRYAKTLDIKELAGAWIENYFGENLMSWEVL